MQIVMLQMTLMIAGEQLERTETEGTIGIAMMLLMAAQVMSSKLFIQLYYKTSNNFDDSAKTLHCYSTS